VSIHACPQRSGLPEAVPAVPEFCDAALAVNPHQVLELRTCRNKKSQKTNELERATGIEPA
jgi:hypothetical protein